MDRRVPFFVGSAVVCVALVPFSDGNLRWVPELTAALYVGLALLVLLESVSRR